MALFLARKWSTIPGADESFWEVREGEDPLYVRSVLSAPFLTTPSLYIANCLGKSSLHTRAHTHRDIHALNDSHPCTDAIERFKNETLRVYGVLEIQLSGKFTGAPKEYLAGNGKGKYSVADIGTWPWVRGWSFSGLTEEDMEPFPHLLKWIDRIAERPAVKRGTGDKYSMDKK